MHVCLVHRDMHEPARGGVCTVYRALAERLIGRGHHVSVVTQRTPHPLRTPGLRMATLPRTESMGAHRQAVARALDRLRPDVVDSSTWEAETLDYLRRPRGERAPVVVRGDLSAHTMGATDLACDERELVHLADRVISVSDFAARDLAAAYGVPVPAIVPNGIDRGRFHPGSPAPPVRGYQVAVDATGQMAHEIPLDRLTSARVPLPPWTPDPGGRSHLVWIGKITPMKGWDRLERLAHRLRRIARITVLLGHSPAYCPVTVDGRGDVTILRDLDDTDLPGFYRAADWLLCTSRWEGFGLAIGEALACGTPALLPDDLGTAPELLDAGGGYTYRDGDHLAEIITRRPRPPGRLPQRFDWDANAEASLAAYHALLPTPVG